MEKKENKTNQVFKLLGFSMEQANNVPKIVEKKGKKWIEFGEKDNYPDFLIETLYNSAKHNAICKAKADFIAGKGIKKGSVELNEFIRNKYGEENLEVIAFKAAYDLVVHGYFVLNINWSNDRTKIASIEYIPAKQMRLATKCEDQIDTLQYFYLCSDWKKWRQAEYTPKLVQGYSALYNGRKDGEGNEVGSPNQLYMFGEYRPGIEFYSLPDYVSGIDYISLDSEIIQYHLSSVKNGFSPSYIINFNTIPTDDEMVQAQRDLEKQYGGAPNAGKIIMTFSDGKDRAPEIHKIDTLDSDQRFVDLLSLVNEGIFVSHRTPDVILGASTPGKLGGTQEMENAYTIWKEGVIAPKQKAIEDVLSKFARVNGVEDKVELEDYNIFAGINKPITQ
jgi:hypothetical protein